MIMSDIRRYMKERKRASIDDLAIHFGAEKTAVEGILETLGARGIVREVGCGSCSSSGGCASAGPKVFIYIAGRYGVDVGSDESLCNSSLS